MLHRARVALSRTRELFRRRSSSAAEQEEEFALHIEMEAAENVRRGMTEADARRAALLRFGGTQRFREETSDARGVVSVDNLVRDARFAFRRLHRAPGFAVGVIATLGIGIGAAVGIGTIVYGVLLRDLPYDHPEQLVRVGFVTDGIPASGDLHSDATFFHFLTSSRSFSGLGSYYTSDAFALTDGDAPERVNIAGVFPSVLTLLRVRPVIGQLFEPGDTSWYEGHRQGVLISENLWRRRYGGDASIIGRSIDIDHGERTVLGVLPRSFAFPISGIDLFYPKPAPIRHPEINGRFVNVIGRLRDGVTPEHAQAELTALIPSLSDRFPAITREMLVQSRARVTVEPLKAATVAAVRPQLLLLGVLVAVVLLIATTNVVNLFLLRTERASQETAIALSLGASRTALAQRFVIEGVVLGLVSSVVALPVAAFALSTKFGFTEREIPRLHEISFTLTTAAVVLGCAVLIGACVGLIGLTGTSVAGLFDRLRSSRSTSSRSWKRAQDGLVAFQISIALVLLVAAGLLGRSFWNLREADIGFNPANAMTFHVSLPWATYQTYTDHVAFHARVSDRLLALPGVSSVAVAQRLPLAARTQPTPELQLQGDADGRPVISAVGNLASADYFRVMGIPVLAGRGFRSGDLRAGPAVVLSQRLAKELFGSADVVGRPVRLLRDGSATRIFSVVGVVGDVQWARIEDGYVSMLYFPLLRDGDGLPVDSNVVMYQPRDVQFIIRGTQPPSAATIQQLVKALDRRVPSSDIRSLGSYVDDATARVRLTMLLIAFAGGAALLLGVIGVYTVVAYAANGRVREFGIRLALGAAPTRIGRMVLGDGLKLIGTGTVVGLLAALGATRFLRALLYEVQPTSAQEFAIATALLVAVTLVATLFPARRAARTHPGVVLRGE